MFCEKCGAKLDDSEKICHVCGAPTDEDEDDLITSDNMSQSQDSIGSVPGSSSGSFLYSGQYNSNPAQGNPLQTGSWQSFNPQQPGNFQQSYNSQQGFNSQQVYSPQQGFNSQQVYNPQQGFNSQQVYNPQQGFNSQQSYNSQQSFNPQQGYNPQQNFNPQGSPHIPNPYGMRPTISAKPVIRIRLLPLFGLGIAVVIAAIIMLFTGGKKEPVESIPSSGLDSVSVQKVNESSVNSTENPNSGNSKLADSDGSKGGSDSESEKTLKESETVSETLENSSDKSLSADSSSSSDKSSSVKSDSGNSYDNSSSDSSNSSEGSDTGRYSNLSSTDRPKMSEFKWWYDDGVLQNGIPDGVRWLNASEYQGSWKGFIVYDLENKYNCYMEELVNFDVEVTANGVTLTVDWYMSRIDGETVDEEYMGDSIFTGYEYGEGIYVTDAGNITIDNFYELDGKQYAIGHLTAQDGTEAEIAMMRP